MCSEDYGCGIFVYRIYQGFHSQRVSHLKRREIKTLVKIDL